MRKLKPAGFTFDEFNRIVEKAPLSLLIPIQRLFADSRLTESEKISALNTLKSEIDWNNLSDDPTTQRDKNRDTRLDLANLESNTYFTKLTTEDLRDRIEADYPSLDQWQVNISAGVALENAYAYFSGYSRPSNTLVVTETAGAPKIRNTRPDFQHGTLHEDINTNEKVYYPYAGKIEVKVSQNPVTLSTNNWQIAAEIAMSYAAAPEDQFIRMFNGENPVKHAGHPERKAGSFTLVLPFGATYDAQIEAECTRLNVNFYVSYAFLGQNGEVVFSNPERKNNITPEVKPGTGNLDRGALFDFEKATVYWRDNQKKNNLKNETNNALDGSE